MRILEEIKHLRCKTNASPICLKCRPARLRAWLGLTQCRFKSCLRHTKGHGLSLSRGGEHVPFLFRPGGPGSDHPDDKVYIASEEGVVVVLDAGGKLNILAKNKLDGAILATPALVDSNIYVRTENHLYAFGK